jgi:hypothetical protein
MKIKRSDGKVHEVIQLKPVVIAGITATHDVLVSGVLHGDDVLSCDIGLGTSWLDGFMIERVRDA